MRTALWIVVAIAVAATGCSGDDGDGAAPTSRGSDQDFEIVLSAGKRIAFAERAAQVVEGDALADDVVDDIVRRLPPFAGGEGDRQDFRRPPEALPRPRVGRTIEQPLGGTGERAAPSAPAGPLEVVRRQPEGDVEVAPSLSVTFNQPMVPLGTLDQLDDEDVPVRVTPQLDGRWRWIGTRTVRFEHAGRGVDRLPMATEFRVEVPAGTRSQAGSTLDDAVTWTFRTPPPKVRALLPDAERIAAEPVFLAVFDQRVDPEVLGTVVLEAGGDRRDVRLATAEEVAADEVIHQRQERAQAGRTVAFRPTGPLPADAKVTVEIGPGTPSAEGPRASAEPATFDRRTHGAFRLTGHGCGGQTCRTDSELSITFDNPIDFESFDAEAIEISPDPGARINVYANTLGVLGAWRANTTYEVRVPASLRDEFGQRLGAAQTVRFEVGAARPVLDPFPRPLITADPHAERPSVSVTSAGHDKLRVDIYSVQPDDYEAYGAYLDAGGSYGEAVRPAWPRLSSGEVEVAGDPDERSETPIDLEEALDGRPGHAVVVVTPVRSFPKRSDDHWSNRPTITWVQVTSLGLDAVADRDGVVAWVTDLRDGAAVEGASIRFGGAQGGTRTGADGLATMPATRSRVLVASRGGDSALLTTDYGSWESQPVTDSVRWFVFDDRQLYRPGEHARVKGWLRRLTRTREARLEPLGGRRALRYVLRDGQGNELASGPATLNDAGGFDLDVAIPAGAALGSAFLELHLAEPGDLADAVHMHQLQVQEFRRPEFEVTTRAESPGPHRLARPVTVRAGARYFAGGALATAPVTWRVTQRPTSFAPPNRPDFTFGVWRPPWLGEGGYAAAGLVADGPCCPPPEEIEELTYRGRTDAGGDHLLQLDFEGQKPDLPISVSANAAVEDVNRQQVGSTVDLLVHPASVYVGLRSARTFVRQGQALVVEAIVTDLDGDAVAGREITMTAARVEQQLVRGEWKAVEGESEECAVTSAQKPVSCSFATTTGGEYRIRSVVTDADGGRNRSELTRWVSGGEAIPTREVEQQQVTIVPDRAEYEVGDTAELLVLSPLGAAHGRLTVGRNGIESTRTFDLRGGSTVVELPITEALVPGVDVQVDLVGTTTRAGADGSAATDLPPRAAFATGTITLAIPPRSSVLKVTAEPEVRELEPGGETTVGVTVLGADGAPLGGVEVAVVVVDEAVLSLTGYGPPDPIGQLYQPLGNELRSDHGRRSLVLADPTTFGDSDERSMTTSDGRQGADEVQRSAALDSSSGAAAAMPGAAGASTGYADNPTAPIWERTEFDPLAVFAPSLRTGADGTVRVPVRVPDNLTRYRVMAVATDGGARFGSGESTLTARIPLMVRPSAPRFLNFGDRFELPVVLQNQTDGPLDVSVVVEAANLGLDGPGGRVARVPANGRVEVRFPAEATTAGTGRYRVTAVSGAMADSASGSFPVYTPVTTEAFATYGVVDDGGAVLHGLRTPSGVVPQFGGLEIDTSSTAVQALTDAVVYLVEYPYESADAYASRAMALVSLREVFAAFAADGMPSPEQLDRTIRADLEALVGLQDAEGGFPTWERGQRPDPYATVQATHALVVAGAAGFPVPDGARERALDAVKGMEAWFTPDWDRSARSALSAYALHVRNLAGDRDSGKAEALYREDGDLPLDALAWLWPVVADGAVDAEIERTFANRVTETPAGATFASGYEEGAHLVLASDRRTDGVVLDALLTKRPTSDLIPKVVNGLVGNQVRGRWGNVQENTFILLALRRYFATFESQTPAFVARTWLGDTYTAEHPFQGRSVERQRTLVPMEALDGDPDVVIGKDGPGRLYYRLGLRYAPADLQQRARDEGFVVDRTYEAVDDERDVRRDSDGTWHIAPGAMVRVRLTMVADSARTNVALVDSLPAGLEAVNPALATSPRPPQDRRGVERSSPGFSWFDHQHLRDDRAEAFGSYLGAGTYEYSYVARATTPGTFVAPPAKAEEIYAPEVFGRSGTATVHISTVSR